MTGDYRMYARTSAYETGTAISRFLFSIPTFLCVTRDDPEHVEAALREFETATADFVDC